MVSSSIDFFLKLIFLAAIILQKGSDAWWFLSVEDLLPAKYRDKASEYVKGADTMDVWFDSGEYHFPFNPLEGTRTFNTFMFIVNITSQTC